MRTLLFNVLEGDECPFCVWRKYFIHDSFAILIALSCLKYHFNLKLYALLNFDEYYCVNRILKRVGNFGEINQKDSFSFLNLLTKFVFKCILLGNSFEATHKRDNNLEIQSRRGHLFFGEIPCTTGVRKKCLNLNRPTYLA